MGAPSHSWRPALAVLAAVIGVAVLGPVLWRVDPNRVGDLATLRSAASSWAHPLGTDENARDLLARLIAGARVSMAFGVLAAAVTAVIGAGVGLLAAVSRPWVDRACMSVVDVGIAVPRLLLLIVLTAAFGRLSWGWLAVAMGTTGWFALARLVRARARALVGGDFAVAARALGAPTMRVAVRHLIPNVTGTIAAATVLAFAHAVTLEAALSFIGQGAEIPIATWGGLISEGRAQIATAPRLVLLPAIAIVVTVLAAGVVADRVERGEPWTRANGAR